MVKRAALILAGGRARRFQAQNQPWQDKALVELYGKPLLVHAVQNVKDVVNQTVVCVNDQERKAKYTQVLETHGLAEIEVVVDEQNGYVSGPTLAIATGLGLVDADYCFTLPCDMPFLHSSVADYMLTEVEGFEVAVPMWPNGRLETLVMALQRQRAWEIAETLCRLKRPRTDDIPRGASKPLMISPLKKIKALDPDLKSFVNINSKEDLTHPQTRRAHGSVKENLALHLGVFSASDLQGLREGAKMLGEGNLVEAQRVFGECGGNFEADDSFFWAAVAAENQGEALLELSRQRNEHKTASELDFEGKEAYLKAANNYRLEAEIHENNRCLLLAERALADKTWCESWAMGKHSHVHRYPSKVAKL
jgi:molybdenum cofactor guanylyltransferase